GPDVLVCMGGPSAQTLLGSRDGILKTRGRWFAFQTGSREIRAIATLHPAYLLRQPLQKRLAWRDFLAIRKALAPAEPASSASGRLRPSGLCVMRERRSRIAALRASIQLQAASARQRELERKQQRQAQHGRLGVGEPAGHDLAERIGDEA